MSICTLFGRRRVKSNLANPVWPAAAVEFLMGPLWPLQSDAAAIMPVCPCVSVVTVKTGTAFQWNLSYRPSMTTHCRPDNASLPTSSVNNSMDDRRTTAPSVFHSSSYKRIWANEQAAIDSSTIALVHFLVIFLVCVCVCVTIIIIIIIRRLVPYLQQKTGPIRHYNKSTHA